MNKKRAGKVAIGTLIGAGIGYAAGVLTAPKSGKETRQDIRKAAARAKSEAERNLKKAHSDLDNMLAKGKAQAKKAGSKAQAGMSDAIAKGQKAKDKAREILSALHEGEANDQDLDKAVKDTKSALAHLKKFIKSS